MPNLFVTGIILDYLPLVSENPSPLPFLEKKKTLLGDDYTPPPPSETLILKKFLQSTSTSLLIINPLHSRVAHRSFDLHTLFIQNDTKTSVKKLEQCFAINNIMSSYAENEAIFSKTKNPAGLVHATGVHGLKSHFLWLL